MSLPVALSPEAEADLDEAAAWHEQQSAGLGVELVAEVRDALGRVGDHPEAYSEVRSGIRRAPVRRFAYGGYSTGCARIGSR
jgi:plasmid stabilization system protein ParE